MVYIEKNAYTDWNIQIWTRQLPFFRLGHCVLGGNLSQNSALLPSSLPQWWIDHLGNIELYSVITVLPTKYNYIYYIQYKHQSPIRGKINSDQLYWWLIQLQTMAFPCLFVGTRMRLKSTKCWVSNPPKHKNNITNK